MRQDGTRFGFSTSDHDLRLRRRHRISPINGINPSAIVRKADASVDNLEIQVIIYETITEAGPPLRRLGQRVRPSLLVCPYHPEWGIAPMRGGNFGEIHVKEGQFTVQFRALFEQLQLPFGYKYTLNCRAQLGDPRCKVKLAPRSGSRTRPTPSAS